MKYLIIPFILLPLCCRADLGGNAASVSADARALQASRSASSSTRFTVDILQLPSGTVVKEFSNNGTVFGIAWQGPFMPDLKQLLGSHFGIYVGILHAGTGPGYVETPGLVVRSGGHMRAFSGQAYLPSLLPSGVLPSDIQ